MQAQPLFLNISSPRFRTHSSFLALLTPASTLWPFDSSAEPTWAHLYWDTSVHLLSLMQGSDTVLLLQLLRLLTCSLLFHAHSWVLILFVLLKPPKYPAIQKSKNSRWIVWNPVLCSYPLQSRKKPRLIEQASKETQVRRFLFILLVHCSRSGTSDVTETLYCLFSSISMTVPLRTTQIYGFV